jgi:hypothetical protein
MGDLKILLNSPIFRSPALTKQLLFFSVLVEILFFTELCINM